MRSRLLAVCFLGCALVGCASTTSLLRERFAKERACDAALVKVRHVGGTQYLALGCDQSATYDCDAFAGGSQTASRCVERGAVRPGMAGERERPAERFNVFPAPTAR